MNEKRWHRENCRQFPRSWRPPQRGHSTPVQPTDARRSPHAGRAATVAKPRKCAHQRTLRDGLRSAGTKVKYQAIEKRVFAVRKLGLTDRLFIPIVIIPVALSIVYFGFLASDVYVSESKFVVRSPDKPASTGL